VDQAKIISKQLKGAVTSQQLSEEEEDSFGDGTNKLNESDFPMT
jgi:hypothetical protein